MWTFNDALYSGQFPLQRWTKSTRQRVAVTMVQFLQQQHFEKTARPSVFWETLTNIVALSERITVIIVSSGNEAITGTPFDESIAENFSKNKVAQRKANMPFVTILRAYHGSFVSFSVNMAPWPIELPEYPKEARRAPEPATPKPAPAATKPAPPPMPAVTDYTPVYATNVPAVEPAPAAAETTVAPLNPVPTTPQTNVIAATKPEPTPQISIKQAPETLSASGQKRRCPW
jgi:hypothetical protein